MKKFFFFMATTLAFSVTSQASLSDYVQGCKNSCVKAISDMAARTYYATSVSGYGSLIKPIAKSIDNYLIKNGWDKLTFIDYIENTVEIKENLEAIKKTICTEFDTSNPKAQEVIIPYYLNTTSNTSGDIQVIAPLIETQTIFSKQHYNQSCRKHVNKFLLTSHLNDFTSIPFLRKLLRIFPRQKITLHTFLNIFFEDEPRNSPSHCCYTKISFDPVISSISIEISNPSLKPNYNVFSKDAWSTISLLNPNSGLEGKIRNIFNDISDKLDLKEFNFKYTYVGNQVFNECDCARFSIVYLLNSTKGIDPSQLNPIDIYKGFKEIERNGYDYFHQHPDPKWGFFPKKKSWIALISGPRRAFAEWVLAKMGAYEKNEPFLPQD